MELEMKDVREGLNKAFDSLKKAKVKPIRKSVSLPMDADTTLVFGRYKEVVLGGLHSAWNSAVDEIFDSFDVVARDFVKRFGDRTWGEFMEILQTAVKQSDLEEDTKKEILNNILKSAEDKSLSYDAKIGESPEALYGVIKAARLVSKRMYYGVSDVAFGMFSASHRKQESRDFDEWSDEWSEKGEKAQLGEL